MYRCESLYLCQQHKLYSLTLRLTTKCGQRTQTTGGRGALVTQHTYIAQSYLFVPVAAETMGAINKDGMDFLSDLGRQITQSKDDHRESAFLF